MKEGIIVLVREPNVEIRFCNKSAEKIFGKPWPKTEDNKLMASDLSKPRFLRSKLVKENSDPQSQALHDRIE